MLRIVVSVATLLYFSNAHLFFFNAGLIFVKPVHWYLATLLIGGGVLVARHILGSLKLGWSPMLTWAVTFISMASLSFVIGGAENDESVQAYISAVEQIALLCFFTLALQEREVLRASTWVVAVVTVFAVLLNVVEFIDAEYLGVPMSTVSGRSAGLYENPNIAGQQLVFGMALAAPLLRRPLRLTFCVFVGVGVLLTFSRGAILLWAVAVTAIAWFQGIVINRWAGSIATMLCVVMLALMLVDGGWLNAIRRAGLGHYLTDNTEQRIGSLFTRQRDYSSTERASVAIRGVEMFLEKPIQGWGIGATNSGMSRIEPHNQYILMGIEYGIFGIVMLVALIVVVWRSGGGSAITIAALYAIGCLFTHNNFGQANVTLAIAIAVSRVPSARHRHRRSPLARRADGSGVTLQ